MESHLSRFEWNPLTKFTAMINVMLVIISLSLAIILLPKIGLVGAAIGSIIAYVFASLIGVIFFVRNTDKFLSS